MSALLGQPPATEEDVNVIRGFYTVMGMPATQAGPAISIIPVLAPPYVFSQPKYLFRYVPGVIKLNAFMKGEILTTKSPTGMPLMTLAQAVCLPLWVLSFHWSSSSQ